MNERRKEKIERVVASRQRGVTIVLEDLHDPHNVAAILRTCDAFGIQDIICVYEKEKYVNPKKVGKSSSSSANKWLDFTVFRSSSECIQYLKQNKYRIISTMLDEKAEPLSDSIFIDEPIALVFGNEHRGVSDIMATASDNKVYIPMKGMVQSLNVSVTAAICIAELDRQRRETGKDFSFSDEYKQKLIADFLER
ncbi:MAG: RNA methyltransferase [Candidatus Magasanikbacteria bacterium]|nr:RNA methyltransferase [Candidatus Magasanikbacteria bacterium]